MRTIGGPAQAAQHGRSWEPRLGLQVCRIHPVGAELDGKLRTRLAHPAAAVPRLDSSECSLIIARRQHTSDSSRIGDSPELLRRNSSGESPVVPGAEVSVSCLTQSSRLLSKPSRSAFCVSEPSRAVERAGACWIAVPAGVDRAGPCIELSCVDAVHGRRRRLLRDCMTGRLEDVDPLRTFRWSRGERHFPGWYWAATTGRQVGFESWLQRDRLPLMDFDPSLVGISSQPFWLHWHDGERKRRHASDCFVRRVDGSAAVVNVCVDNRIEPKDARHSK
ncbi:TnsA-like heteromeric transposase endonuclease subunit [Streptomyces sp. NPDC048663]|uniref:TnsA-like heteromeric transposase endonuclease subunit n=1 Tax=Streptomyces sp. NPDC048663 TaxID=3155638 RepID=UPI00341BAC14